MIIIIIKKGKNMQCKLNKNSLNQTQSNQVKKNSHTPAEQQKNNFPDNGLEAESPSIEDLKTTILYLMTKFAATQHKNYALAAYKHLCMISDRHNKDSELHFLNHSLAIEWHSIYHGVAYPSQKDTKDSTMN